MNVLALVNHLRTAVILDGVHIHLVSKHLGHLLKRLSFRLGEEQEDDDEVDGVEANEEDVVLPADVLDGEI